jgi:outer membrane protein
LNVRDAYFKVLGAEAVLRAAQAAQSNRHLIARQLTALAQSQLRSTVDVNFAEVLASEADLAAVRAQSSVAQQRAALATAMGSSQPTTLPLVEVALPETLPLDAESFLQQAQTKRADLNAIEAQQRASAQFATAEKRLSYPTLNVLGAAGQIPYHDRTLQSDYAAAGFNLNIPIFTGGIFAGRRAEAELEASARTRDVQQLKLQVSKEVRDSWYLADEAYKSLNVTTRLVAQSKEALRLAQARYDAGLGSIVELNEAQLNETSAEITAADATYTYLSRRTESLVLGRDIIDALIREMRDVGPSLGALYRRLRGDDVRLGCGNSCIRLGDIIRNLWNLENCKDLALLDMGPDINPNLLDVTSNLGHHIHVLEWLKFS